jgi:hypothetical protein
MLRQPGSAYHVGRSSTLLKVKTFHDAEARVVGHAPGTGKHKGRLGALIVELADGTRFNVGTGLSDAERGSPPKVGSGSRFATRSCPTTACGFRATSASASEGAAAAQASRAEAGRHRPTMTTTMDR